MYYDEDLKEIIEEFVRKQYSNLTDEEYAQKRLNDQITTKEDVFSCLENDLKIYDAIFEKYEIDTYCKEIVFGSGELKVAESLKSALLKELNEVKFSASTIEEACAQKNFMDFLLDEVEIELKILKETRDLYIVEKGHDENEKN